MILFYSYIYYVFPHWNRHNIWAHSKIAWRKTWTLLIRTRTLRKFLRYKFWMIIFLMHCSVVWKKFCPNLLCRIIPGNWLINKSRFTRKINFLFLYYSYLELYRLSCYAVIYHNMRNYKQLETNYVCLVIYQVLRFWFWGG